MDSQTNKDIVRNKLNCDYYSATLKFLCFVQKKKIRRKKLPNEEQQMGNRQYKKKIVFFKQFNIKMIINILKLQIQIY